MQRSRREKPGKRLTRLAAFVGLMFMMSGCGGSDVSSTSPTTSVTSNTGGASMAEQPTTVDTTSSTPLFIQSNQQVLPETGERIMVPTYRLFDPYRDARAAAGGAPTAAPISPAQMRHVYGFDQLSATGAGQTIAIVDAPGDPNAAQALNNFCNTFSLPPASFSSVFASGHAPSRYDSGWGLETDLDIEWAHAIAPSAKILLVVANSASDNDLLTAVSYASSHANVVSMSWGGSEFSGQTALDSYFATAGVSYFASSGDSGAGVEWPAASANVTGVGGTTLLLNADGSRYSETAWSDGGGGTSSQVPEPSWQNSAQTSGMRQIPDISYDADPNTGVIVVDSNNGQTQVGGTSMGSPEWAAFSALLNSGRSGAAPGSLNPSLYPLGSPSVDFFDVISGSDGSASQDKATVGYDEVTGLGTPQGATLFSSLTGGASPSPSPSPAPSPSPSPAPSPSPSPSPAPSPSPSPSPAPSPSPSPSPAPSPSPTPGAPQAPINLKASEVSSTTINLRWTNVSSAKSISLQYSTDQVHYSSLGSVAGTATTVTISGARRHNTYYFRLQAVASNGQTSPYSKVASVTMH